MSTRQKVISLPDRTVIPIGRKINVTHIALNHVTTTSYAFQGIPVSVFLLY
ncbi:MAG: hypothetical protein ACTS85_00440 [Arsenophonus sp. NC-PG7-MAG3]